MFREMRKGMQQMRDQLASLQAQIDGLKDERESPMTMGFPTIYESNLRESTRSPTYWEDIKKQSEQIRFSFRLAP
jgi:hypothetical protein